MGFVPQITCRSCGTKFSALRGRCPKCGARHVKQTGRTAPAAPVSAPGASGAAEARQKPASGGGTSGANGRWQLVFGLILIAAVIAAVIILIVASGDPPEAPPVEIPSPSLEVTTPPPPPTTPQPSTPSPVTVTGMIITYGGQPLAFDPFTQKLSSKIQLGVTVYPTEALAEYKVEWRCSDESVATVDETGLVTPLAVGECEIIAECGGVATKCGMWVRQ